MNRLKSVGALSSVSNFRNVHLLSKVKEIKRLCGDVAGYVAQTNAPIDAEIGQKRPFMDGNESSSLRASQIRQAST